MGKGLIRMTKIGLIGYGSMADMIAVQLLKHQFIRANELYIDTRSRGERLQNWKQTIRTLQLVLLSLGLRSAGWF